MKATEGYDRLEGLLKNLNNVVENSKIWRLRIANNEHRYKILIYYKDTLVIVKETILTPHMTEEVFQNEVGRLYNSLFLELCMAGLYHNKEVILNLHNKEK